MSSCAVIVDNYLVFPEESKCRVAIPHVRSELLCGVLHQETAKTIHNAKSSACLLIDVLL